MTEITSKAAGPRVLNVVSGKGEDGKPVVEQLVIHPRETLDVELHQPDHPATKALFDRKDLVYGRPEDEAKAKADAKSAELKAEFDRGFAEGVKSVKKS
jgi:hypothetical protein